MTQARIEHDGRTLYAWKVTVVLSRVTQQTKVYRTWAASEQEARDKCAFKGTVIKVAPAESLA